MRSFTCDGWLGGLKIAIGIRKRAIKKKKKLNPRTFEGVNAAAEKNEQ